MKAISHYINNEKDEFTKIKLNLYYKNIKRVDKIISYHNSLKSKDKSKILINIFGLLQSLFVSIDALYTLTLTITKSKNYININNNQKLNKLKFIRNDVVGHPLNRRYKDNSIGYGLIDFDNIDINKFNFDIFVNNNNNELYKREETIDLIEIKNNYIIEKDKVLNKLANYINKEIIQTNLDVLLLNLLNNFNEENLSFIKNVYKTHYNDEGDRFLWRVKLVETLINYKKDNDEFNEIINYIKDYQINKLIELLNEIENRDIKTKVLQKPKMLKDIFKYLKNNYNSIKYLEDIHDINNPKYLYNINYLLETSKNNSFNYYLLQLKNETNRNKIYLFGSILNNYYKNML